MPDADAAGEQALGAVREWLQSRRSV